MPERELSEHDASHLRTALGKEFETIPESVIKRYWRVKRGLDRMGISTESYPLILALIAGWDESHMSEGPPLPQVNWKGIPYDTPVLVYWRNKDREALFKGVTADDELRVQIDGDAEVRNVKPVKVTLCEEAFV